MVKTKPPAAPRQPTCLTIWLQSKCLLARNKRQKAKRLQAITGPNGFPPLAENGRKMAIEKMCVCVCMYIYTYIYIYIYIYICVCVKPYLKIFQEIDPFPKFP